MAQKEYSRDARATRRMPLRKIALAAVMLGSIPGYSRVGASLHLQEDWHATSDRNENAVLEYLGPALATAGKGALLYYQGDCREGEKYPVAFPLPNVQRPPKDTRGSAAVREIFRDDKNVAIIEGQSGIITIRIGNVSTAILQTRIAHLNLSQLEQDFPSWTIYRLENTKDVEAAMRKLSFDASPFSPGLVNAVVPSGTPHLPSQMNDVTMQQMLELTAETFKGVVIYGACTQPSGRSLFRLDFVDVVGWPGLRF